MTHFGKIRSYDSGSGTGSIIPEEGGEALRFKRADLQQQSQVPKVDQRFSYKISQIDGARKSAFSLQRQLGDGENQKDQARNQQG